MQPRLQVPGARATVPLDFTDRTTQRYNDYEFWDSGRRAPNPKPRAFPSGPWAAAPVAGPAGALGGQRRVGAGAGHEPCRVSGKGGERDICE